MNERRLLRGVLILSLAAVMPLAGCSRKEGTADTPEGGSTADAESKPQTPNKPAKERLIGTWDLSFDYDLDSAKAFLESEGFWSEENAKKLPELVAGMKATKLTREWRADGTTTGTVLGTAGKRESTGTWKIVSESGDNLQVEVTPKGRNRGEMYEITFQNDDAYVPTKSPFLSKTQVKSPVYNRRK